MENLLSVKNSNGEIININVLDILENNYKKYIIYTVNGIDDNMYISILNEKDREYSLDEISDENELKYIYSYLYNSSEEVINNG